MRGWFFSIGDSGITRVRLGELVAQEFIGECEHPAIAMVDDEDVLCYEEPL